MTNISNWIEKGQIVSQSDAISGERVNVFAITLMKTLKPVSCVLSMRIGSICIHGQNTSQIL